MLLHLQAIITLLYHYTLIQKQAKHSTGLTAVVLAFASLIVLRRPGVGEGERRAAGLAVRQKVKIHHPACQALGNSKVRCRLANSIRPIQHLDSTILIVPLIPKKCYRPIIKGLQEVNGINYL